MKNIRVFVSEIFQFLEVKFSIYLKRRVFVMCASWLCHFLDMLTYYITYTLNGQTRYSLSCHLQAKHNVSLVVSKLKTTGSLKAKNILHVNTCRFPY